MCHKILIPRSLQVWDLQYVTVGDDNSLYFIPVDEPRFTEEVRWPHWSHLSWSGQSRRWQAKPRLNSSALGKCGSSFKSVIFKPILWIIIWSDNCEFALRWMPQNTFGDKSTLVQVMAWCLTAPSHYLSQCRSRSMSPYSVISAQPVNSILVIISHKNSIWILNQYPFTWNILIWV